jgi:hypothetical protein
MKITHHWRGAVYCTIIMNHQFFYHTKISPVSKVFFDGFLMNNILGKPLVYREIELAFVPSLKFTRPLCRFYWRQSKYDRIFGATTVTSNLMKIGHQGTYVRVWIWISIRTYGRSHWLRGLGHEQSSPARTLRSWVRIPPKEWMSLLYVFILCLCCSVCRYRPGDGLFPRPRSPINCV